MQIKASCVSMAFPKGMDIVRKQAGVQWTFMREAAAMPSAGQPAKGRAILSLLLPSLWLLRPLSEDYLVYPLFVAKTSGNVEWSWGTCPHSPAQDSFKQQKNGSFRNSRGQ